MNGITLCFFHHKHWAHTDHEQFRRWLIERIGADEYERLYKLSNIVTHWKIDELMEIKSQLKRMMDK